MRALFLLLVLANIAFYAWARHLAGPDPATDPSPLRRPIDPERLRILPPGPVPQRAKPAAAAAGAAACLEWGSFTLADAPRAQAALARLALGARLTARQTEEHASWWVFIAPQGSRQAAARKAGELKDLGVEDYFIVQDESRYRWALSLGVFRNEAAARERLAALRRQGVRSAEIGQREAVVPKVWLQVREVDAALEARLREVASGIEGSELRACPLTS